MMKDEDRAKLMLVVDQCNTLLTAGHIIGTILGYLFAYVLFNAPASTPLTLTLAIMLVFMYYIALAVTKAYNNRCYAKELLGK